ncbi:MAG: sarcosine oxidase subunit gamma family protein [Pseudomonadota bacterium]
MNIQALKAHADTEGPVTISLLPPRARFNLRIDAEETKRAGSVFGTPLANEITTLTKNGDREALCVGPDEWILQAPEADSDLIKAGFEKLYEEVALSLVDISDREIAIGLKGEHVSELLTVGYPGDIRDFPVGSGRRTVFDSVQAVLYRDSEDSWRLEIWRSFLPHIMDLLETANAEIGAGL